MHALGRPLLAPPGLPAERLRALRQAFDAVMGDPGYLAEVKQLGLATTPSTGAEVETLVARFFGYPRGVVEQATAALRP